MNNRGYKGFKSRRSTKKRTMIVCVLVLTLGMVGFGFLLFKKYSFKINYFLSSYKNPDKILNKNLSDVVLPSTLSENSIQHIALIMDGNRRWAKQMGKPVWVGHKQGVVPLEMSIKFCLKHKIKNLTVYGLSLENLERSKEELDYLFELAQELVEKNLLKIADDGVKIRFLGDRDLFPEKLKIAIDDIEQKTKNNTELTFNILFCYGGQQELAQAAQCFAQKQQLKSCDTPQDLASIKLTQKELFESCLLLHRPYPDVVIRTGGAKRVSNFLMYQIAYSELYFLDCYWPDMTEKHLEDIVSDFEKRERRFGR